MSAEKTNLLVVSDLHLSGGFLPQEGRWSRNEDFIYDEYFFDFLRFNQANKPPNTRWKLIILGDLFDFLQVTTVSTAGLEDLNKKVTQFVSKTKGSGSQPKGKRSETRRQWILSELDKAASQTEKPVSPKNIDAFRQVTDRLCSLIEGISDELFPEAERLALDTLVLSEKKDYELTGREIDHGLGTSAIETVWKLDRIAEGHPVFFEALAWFIGWRNSIHIIKGNHDVELCWEPVQARVCEHVADAYQRIQPGEFSAPEDSLSFDEIRARIHFLPWIYFEPRRIYLEHGNQYEPANAFDNFFEPKLMDRPHLVKLPPGSFLVRYWFNKMEESFPFADNLRPMTRFLTWAFSNDLLRALGLAIRHFPSFVRFISLMTGRGTLNSLKSRLSPKKAQEEPAQTPNSGLEDLQLQTIEQLLKNSEIMRKNILRRIRSIISLSPLLLLVALVGFVLVGPFIWNWLINNLDNYLARLVIVGGIGILAREILAPLALKLASGGDYLEEAAARVNDTLSQMEPSESAPVRYIVFGHNHEAEMKKLSGQTSTWYVNTGCWIRSFEEEKRWLQELRDFTYLQIGSDDNADIPGLYRWNPLYRRPERIRLLMEN